MKKYQMPNVEEVRLESPLFVMEGTSETKHDIPGGGGLPDHTPRKL